MTNRLWKTAAAAALLAMPLLAGGLFLTVSDAESNPEAKAAHAVVLAQMSSCHSPEKTAVVATAIGEVNGARQILPLKVLSLSTPGSFAVTRQWPEKGSWVIKMVATNPEYKNYAAALLVRAEGDMVAWKQAKNFHHEPGAEDVSSFLR